MTKMHLSNKNMNLDLHCNLPYDSTIANPALGYLKGFISTKSDHNVRNIYWNILPVELHKKYHQLLSKTKKFFPYNHEIYLCMHVAHHLYNKTEQKEDAKTLLGLLFTSSFYHTDEIFNFVDEFKRYVHNTINDQSLSDVTIAGFTMSTYQWILNYYVLQQLKKKNPHLNSVIGGIQSKKQGIEFMRLFHQVDFAIWGEGELPLLNLLNSIEKKHKKSTLKDIPNLIFRNDDEIIATKPLNKRQIETINTYPSADHSDYIKSIQKQKIHLQEQYDYCIPIWGSRYCSWNKCKFCVLYKDGFYQEKKPQEIISEIEYQSKIHKTNRFLFLDADIGRKTKKKFDLFLKNLLQSVEQRGKPYQMFAMISPIRLDRKTMKIINAITIETIQIGFEAVTDSLLKKMMKKHNFAHNIQSLKFAQEQNINITSLNIIRGIPSEKKEDVVESIHNLKFLRYFLNQYPLNISELVLFRESPFFKEMNEKEIKESWNRCYGWSEIKNLPFFSKADKFALFGFERNHLVHDSLWDIFETCLNQYQDYPFKYKWYFFADGSSFIKENEKGFRLTQKETNILTFCDTLRSNREIKKEFNELKQTELQTLLKNLKKEGLLYYNTADQGQFISILSSKYKKIESY